MNAAKNGYVAEFVTGYLQREIRLTATVAGGTDNGVRDPLKTGFAVGRLVKITGATDEDRAVVAATGVTANSIGDATHIIAQSDDTVREVPSDYNETERYSYLPNLIVKNSAEKKTIAVYKIVNPDDIKIVKIAEPVNVLSATNVGGTFTVGPATYQIVRTGINTFKVLGTAPYISSPIVSGNPAGNYLYFKLVDSEITTSALYNAATAGVEDSAIVYKRISGIGEHTETKSAIASEINTNGGIEVEACINDTKELIIEVMWTTGNTSVYTFDLTDLAKEVNG